MKMNFTKLSLIASLIFATLFLAGCKEEDKDATGTLEVTAGAKLEATLDAGSYEVKLTSNEEWTAKITGAEGDDLKWITAAPLAGGSGENTIAITVLANPGNKRSATLEIKTASLRAEAKLDQAGVPLTSVTSFEEDFSGITEGEVAFESPNWTIISNDETVAWMTGVFNEDKYIQVKGYESSLDKVITLAKMPPLNVKEATSKLLTLELAVYYQETDDTKVEVVASLDYDEANPTAATWELVENVTIPVEPMNAWIHREVDLSKKYADSEALHVAIRYTGKAITSRLDNVKFGIAKEVVPTAVPTTIAKLRALETGKDLKDNFSITGIVISNNNKENTDGGNLHGQSIIIQDSKDVNSAITIRTTTHDFKLGEKITVTTFNGNLSAYNGMLQLNLKSLDQITSVAAADVAAADALIQTITVAQLEAGNYQSMYVQIEGTQIDSKFFGQPFNDGKEEDSNYGNIGATATKAFTIYTTKYAKFAANIVPENKGTLKGIASVNHPKDKTASFQILPQRPSDFEGLGTSTAPTVTALFHETFGAPAKNTPFADFKTAKGFSKTNQPNAVYAATTTRIDFRTSSASIDKEGANAYEGASGVGNMWFGNIDKVGGVDTGADIPNIFTIDKLTIDKASYMTFGLNLNPKYNPESKVEDMVVSYQVGDAEEWVELTKTSSTPIEGNDWLVVTCAEMPAGVTALKFEVAKKQFRIDDIKILEKK